METFARKSPLYIAAVAVGVTAAWLREHLVGFLAARPWPRWFIPWAHAHKHAASELTWVATSLLPSVLVAVIVGGLLAKRSRRASTIFVLVVAAAWFAYDSAVEVLADVQVCIYPMQCFLQPFRLDPVGSVISLLVPLSTLLGYGWARSARTR